MSEEGVERRLTTILAADVVGYSRFMAADEAGTLAQLKTHRKELIEPKTAEYGGRVVKLMGDGILMEFGSVVDAVHFAVDVQQVMAERNAKVPEDQRITYRIGINIGDIIVEGDDIYGDGVNIAARLEGLAEPGGICVARNVYNQVEAKVDLAFEDLGEQEVKNIPKPVQVFKVLLGSPARAHAAVPVPTVKRSWRGPMVAGGLAMILIVAGIVLWQRPWEPRDEPASEANMAFPLPDKPSIAVLPFTNMSGDPEQEYFADGMAEDLITDLSKISGLFVISRNSAFTYKGKTVKVRQVAEDLGVRYVLEGSVRRVGNEVRINAQLIDATTGGHLWAERYDGSLADIFALQDRVTTKIVDAMSVTLTPQELEDLGSLGTSDVAAHDAYLQGLSFYIRDTPADNAKAGAHFKRAIELDSDFKRAYTALAKVYYKGWDIDYARAMGVYWRTAIFLAYESLAKGVGSNIADAHVVSSWMALNKHQVGVALREAERALDFSANDADALKAKTKALIYSGQYAEGRKLANQIIRLDPAVPGEPLYLIGLSHFASGNYEKAADFVERALGYDPTTSIYAGILAAAYGKLGMEKEAQDAWLKHLNSWLMTPWIAAAVSTYPFQDGEILEHLADGFETAGAAERMRSRYLKLDRENKLTGQEVKSLLFGHTIRGRDYWNGNSWAQKRTIDGKVSHSGQPIHIGSNDAKEGESWIEDDRLCERWPEVSDKVTICVLIFRDSNKGQNDYYMVTDQGPHPFWVSN